MLYLVFYCVLDSAISPRNLDPDFEEADESSDASHESEDDNQLDDKSEQPGADEESKEDSQTNDQSAEGESNLYVHLMSNANVYLRFMLYLKI